MTHYKTVTIVRMSLYLFPTNHVTHILFLHEQVDSGEIMSHILGDDLRLDLTDPAVNVVTALLIEDVTVGVKQLLSLLLCRVLQLLPLLVQLSQLRLHDGGCVWLLPHQLLTLLQVQRVQTVSLTFLRAHDIDFAL